MPTRVAPTVLIVGGGFAGRAALRYLISATPQARVVLVDEKPYFEFTPSVLRCLIHPPHLSQVTFSHEGNGGTFILGRVSHITENEATVARPENNGAVMLSVPFDYCIWATGVAFSHPIRSGFESGIPSTDGRYEEFEYFRNKIRSATEVLVIGGGPIGVELAAELAGARESDAMSITLASPHILPRFPERAGKYAVKWFRKRQVCITPGRMKFSTVLPNEKYEFVNESTGAKSSVDIAFDCTGARSNGAVDALVAGGVCDSSSVNSDGSLSVADTLQLRESPNFFVAGDAARVEGELDLRKLGCEKTAYAAEEAGALAAKNVVVLIRREALSLRKAEDFLKFPRDAFPRGQFPRLFAISLYKFHGILCLGPVVITGRVPALVKMAVEFFGVRSARTNGFLASFFRAMERSAYDVVVFFTAVRNRFRRQAAV